MVWSRSRDPVLGSGVVEHPGGVVEDVADVGAAAGQVGPGRVDVGGDQVRPWAEPGVAEVTPVPKMTEQAEPGGVSWTTR